MGGNHQPVLLGETKGRGGGRLVTVCCQAPYRTGFLVRWQCRVDVPLWNEPSGFAFDGPVFDVSSDRSRGVMREADVLSQKRRYVGLILGRCGFSGRV